MRRILKIIGCDNKQSYALVHVQLDNGEEAQVYVGGEVEVHYDAAHDKIKAFVKKGKS